MPNKLISISGKAFEAGPHGEFTVSQRQLQGYDLNSLPPHTTLFVDGNSIRLGTGVDVILIHGPGSTGFEVFVQYWTCQDCWKHALSYTEFANAVDERLRRAFSEESYYVDTYDGMTILHTISTTRSEHTLEDIEAAVKTDIDNILAQLMAYTLRRDQQVKQQLGV